jgi:hypothetical protein
MESPKHILARIVQPGSLNGTIECGYDKSAIVWYKIHPIVWYLSPCSIRPRIEVCRQYGCSYLPIGPLMPTARGPDRSVSATSHAAGRKVHLPQRNVPACEWYSAGAHVDNSNIVPPEEWGTNTPIFITEVNDTGGFLSRLWAPSPVVRRMTEGFVQRSSKPWALPFMESYRTRRGAVTTTLRRTFPWSHILSARGSEVC